MSWKLHDRHDILLYGCFDFFKKESFAQCFAYGLVPAGLPPNTCTADVFSLTEHRFVISVKFTMSFLYANNW